MKDSDSKLVSSMGTCLLIAPLAVVATIASALVDGWAISLLWGWFLVPLGVPPITLVHAIGISTFLSLVGPHNSSSKNKDGSWKVVIGTLLASFLVPLFAVLIGWIVARFM